MKRLGLAPSWALVLALLDVAVRGRRPRKRRGESIERGATEGDALSTTTTERRSRRRRGVPRSPPRRAHPDASARKAPSGRLRRRTNTIETACETSSTQLEGRRTAAHAGPRLRRGREVQGRAAAATSLRRQKSCQQAGRGAEASPNSAVRSRKLRLLASTDSDLLTRQARRQVLQAGLRRHKWVNRRSAATDLHQDDRGVAAQRDHASAAARETRAPSASPRRSKKSNIGLIAGPLRALNQNDGSSRKRW